MKTMEQWNGSKIDFSKFASPGDEIDDEIYFYFLGVLPPRKMMSFGFLVGEPARHNENGEAMFDAFYESPSSQYYYGGEKTVKDFMDESIILRFNRTEHVVKHPITGDLYTAF